MSLPESAPTAEPFDAPSFGGLARGVSALTAAEGIRVAVSAVLAVYLARRLGAAAFGWWTFAVAVVGYPMALVEAGLTWIGTRDVAAHPHRVAALVRHIVPLRLALAAAGVFVVVLCAFTLASAGSPRLVMIAASASLLTMALTIDWVFYGLERRSVVATANIARVALFAAVAVAIVRGPALVWAVPLSQALGESAAAALLWYRYRSTAGPQKSEPATVGTANLIRQSAPLTLAQFMRALTMWSAVTLLGVRTSAAAVGAFGAAQRLTLLAGGFTTLYFYGYVPLAARAARHGPDAIVGLVRRSAALTALATVPFALVCTAFAAPIVRVTFGAGYADAAPVLRLLVWTIPVSVLGGHFRHTLISLKHMRADATAVAVGAMATVALNLVLTGRLGLIGGAMAMLAGETALVLTAAILVARRVDFY